MSCSAGGRGPGQPSRVGAILINERAKVFKKHMPIAFNNLAVAQHRDMLRYTKTRFETFAPKLQRFVAGDFVYLKRQKTDSLDPRVRRLVLRVKSGGSGGRLILEGRDKKTVRDHVKNCAGVSPSPSGYLAEPEISAWGCRPQLLSLPPDHWWRDYVALRRL
jgi:hypothetical protein